MSKLGALSIAGIPLTIAGHVDANLQTTATAIDFHHHI